jgi:hypothetical protein
MDADAFDFSHQHEPSLTPLERLDRIISSMPPGDPVRGGAAGHREDG